MLRASTSERDLADSPFDVVNHLNAARGLLQTEDERVKLARLNLLAARRARESTAYRDALVLFVVPLTAITLIVFTAQEWRRLRRTAREH